VGPLGFKVSNLGKAIEHPTLNKIHHSTQYSKKINKKPCPHKVKLNTKTLHFRMVWKQVSISTPTHGSRRSNNFSSVRAIGAIGLGLEDLATRTNTIGQIVQGVDGHLPVDAGISDTDTAEEVSGSLRGNLLVTLVDVGLDHDTDDTSLTLAQLVGDLLGDDGLVKVVLLRVAVGAVDHDDFAQLLRAQSLAGSADTLAVVVGAPVATAEDDEAVLVTGGLGDSGQTLLGDTEETVGVGGSADGVDGDGKVAVCAVLVADGEGETGGQLAVKLGLGGAGADGTEGDEIGQVLGGDGVKHLTGDGETGGGQVDVEFAGDTETLVDVVGLIDVGIVDQTLPADGGTGLLKVGAHDDAEVLGELVGELLEAASIFEGSVGIVDGARANHDQETVIALLNDLDGLIATLANDFNGTVGLVTKSSVFARANMKAG
jgi:hypothetical protein